MNRPSFQLFASLVVMVMISSLQYGWNLFQEPIRAAHSWQVSDVVFAFTVFAFLQTFVQPLDGWFIDRLGPRGFISVAGILCGIGWSAMGYAHTLPQLYFAYGMAGIGAAFVYSGAIGSALKWYPTRRGFASGVIAAGFGGGTAFFALAISYIIRNHGYPTAFLWTGILQGAVILVMAQFLRHPGPDFKPAKAAMAAAAANSRRNNENFTPGEMFHTSQFYILYVMFVAMATGGLFVTANAGSIVKSWGFSAAVLTTINFINPLANAASRIFWGWFSDRKGRETAMVVAFMLQAICLISVVAFGRTSPLMFTITLAVVFFTWGEVFSLFPSTSGDYFGSKHSTSNYGFLYTAKGMAAIIGPFIGAKIFEQTQSWSAVFYGSAILALFAGSAAFVLRRKPLPSKPVSGSVSA